MVRCRGSVAPRLRQRLRARHPALPRLDRRLPRAAPGRGPGGTTRRRLTCSFSLPLARTKEGLMRQYRSETKLQGWRALAVYEDGSECLLFLGRSTTQVRSGYGLAFAELLTDEERARVRSISLQ